MTYIIAEPCIDVKDQSCIQVCPADCIYELDRMLVINPVECIDCGACEPECPVQAIFPDGALPEDWKAFADVTAQAVTGLDDANRLANAYAEERNLKLPNSP
jgi:ferredoxin